MTLQVSILLVIVIEKDEKDYNWEGSGAVTQKPP